MSVLCDQETLNHRFEMLLPARHPELDNFLDLTPFRREHIGLQSGNELYVKFEQHDSGSFKERGALNALLLARDNGIDSVVTASAGNFGAGVARAARILGVHASVYVPAATPETKLNMIMAQGGEHVTLIQIGTTFESAKDAAMDHELLTGDHYIDPFDNPDVIAGNGTAVSEMLRQATDTGVHLDYLFVPVGGGGLLAAASAAIVKHSPDTTLVGVQFSGNDSLSKSLASGQVTAATAVDSLCEGSAVSRMGQAPFGIVQSFRLEHRLESLTVSPAELGWQLQKEDRLHHEISAAMGEEAWRYFPEATAMLGYTGALRYFETHPELRLTTAATIVTGFNADFTKINWLIETNKAAAHLSRTT